MGQHQRVVLHYYDILRSHVFGEVIGQSEVRLCVGKGWIGECGRIQNDCSCEL